MRKIVWWLLCLKRKSKTITSPKIAQFTVPLFLVVLTQNTHFWQRLSLSTLSQIRWSSFGKLSLWGWSYSYLRGAVRLCTFIYFIFVIVIFLIEVWHFWDFNAQKSENTEEKKIQNYEYVYSWSYLYFRVNIPWAVRIPAVNPGVGFGQLSRFQTLAFQFIQPIYEIWKHVV